MAHLRANKAYDSRGLVDFDGHCLWGIMVLVPSLFQKDAKCFASVPFGCAHFRWTFEEAKTILNSLDFQKGCIKIASGNQNKKAGQHSDV